MLTSFPTNLPPLKDEAPYIIIGSGIAGLFSALELSKNGRVILITKTSLNESNTYYAQGGIAAALGNMTPRSFTIKTLLWQELAYAIPKLC
jgi:L-aspartate oxidase